MLLLLRNLTDGNEAAGAFSQAAAAWSASAVESFPATASFTQAAGSWAATAAESFPSTASFVQAAGSWSATETESFPSTASFTQAAGSWSATAITATASFTSTASFTQVAGSWTATSTNTPCTDIFDPAIFDPAIFDQCVAVTQYGGYSYRIPQVRSPEPVYLTAAFAQKPAGWAADMDVNNDEPLLLEDVLELVAV